MGGGGLLPFTGAIGHWLTLYLLLQYMYLAWRMVLCIVEQYSFDMIKGQFFPS